MMMHSPHLRCGLNLNSCLSHMHLQYSPMRKITAQGVLAAPVVQDLRGCMRACSGLGRTPETSTAGLARLFCVGASCLITGERDGAGIGLFAVRPVSPECARLSCRIGVLGGVSVCLGCLGLSRSFCSLN